MPDVTDYLANLPADQRSALERVRHVVEAAVPAAEEGTSYGMPAFLYAGRPLLGLRAARSHLSVFPFSPRVVEAVAGRLDGFELSKGTIRFTPERPVPEQVLQDVVALRLIEIQAR